jgi:hypothetical protein
MTSTEILSGVVDRAKAKIDATHQAVLTFVPRILDAYKRAQDADKQGFNQSLDANIALSKILSEAKAAAVKRKLKWTDWRAEHIPQITQTKASLCMRLYKGKDRLTKPDRATDDGKRISDGVATALADGKMSVRKAAALLVTRTRTNPPNSSGNGDLDVVKRCIKEVLAADELVAIAKEVRDADYLKGMAAELKKVLEAEGPTSTATPTAVPSGGMARRI